MTTLDNQLQFYFPYKSLLQSYKQFVAETDLETETIRCCPHHNTPRSNRHHLQVHLAPHHSNPRPESSRNQGGVPELCQLPGQQRLRYSRTSSDHQEIESQGQQEEAEVETEAGGSLQQQQGGVRANTSHILQAETEDKAADHQQSLFQPVTSSQSGKTEQLHQPERIYQVQQ